MNRFYLTLALGIFFCINAISAQEFKFPRNSNYLNSVPTPTKFFGYEIGAWHPDYFQVVAYTKELDQISDRVQTQTIGFTHQQKPLQAVIISSPQNLQRLESIRQNHLNRLEGKNNDMNAPAMVFLNYTIHGNEPSGLGASIAMMYHLAASQSKEVSDLLENLVVIIDPCMNPDGYQKFVTWVNSNRSFNGEGNPVDREFNEPWPGSRYNHYGYDMNRDWMAVTQPESQARIAWFHQWKPNVLGDYHEMGTNATYFFQPGVPSRTNPLTPAINQELTKKIANYHAKNLDALGSAYYSAEGFDDFYYGKGSTYPDINGCVGILFEQASSRGHAQQSVNGLVTFAFTIQNQFATSLSTLTAAKDLRKELLVYQQQFFQNQKGKTKQYWLASKGDVSKLDAFAKMMQNHQIEVVQPTKSVTIKGKNYPNSQVIALQTNAFNIGLVEGMFDRRTQFADSLFYDISSWSMDLAYGLELEIGNKSVETVPYSLKRDDSFLLDKNSKVFLVDWQDRMAPKVAFELLQKQVLVKVAKRKFQYQGKEFPHGTLIINAKQPNISEEKLHELLQQMIAIHPVTITGLPTFDTTGINLGSPQVAALNLPKMAMLVGNGMTPQDVAEIWHLADQTMQVPLVKIDVQNWNRIQWNDFNVIILPSGRLQLSESQNKDLENWMVNGGTIIGIKNAVTFLHSQKWIDADWKKNENTSKAKGILYENKSDYEGAKQLGGAILEANLDLTHPINYGISSNKIAVFKNHLSAMQPDSQSYNNPILFSSKPLISGYAPKGIPEFLGNTSVFKVARKGSGRVVAINDNPLFRSYWVATEKWFWNAVFFAKEM